jgi:hypothetical protein
MIDLRQRISPTWPQTLLEVLDRARRAASAGAVVFDLDSTVFDNRPRQARIVREYGVANDLAALRGCQPMHFTSGWSLEAAALACGLSAGDYRLHAAALKAYWAERFFTSEYCQDDIEVLGAPRFLQALVKTGVKVLYVTGRHEEMRAGTVRCLQKCAMPLPSADGAVLLLMKPTLREDDDAYKRSVHRHLGEYGTILAAFDNEPTHVNDYAVEFPDALAVHLATDHSGRPVALHERVISIPHFAW